MKFNPSELLGCDQTIQNFKAQDPHTRACLSDKPSAVLETGSEMVCDVFASPKLE